MQAMMFETKQRLEDSVPFAMNPVVYDFAINERGTFGELITEGANLLPDGYYALTVPLLLRTDPRLISPAKRRELDRLAERRVSRLPMPGLSRTCSIACCHPLQAKASHNRQRCFLF